MSEVLEIRTGQEVSEVVERLAREMGDDRLCLPVGSTVQEGEWVRFSVMLEDGTLVIEGVGRSEGAVPRGGASKMFDLYLAELSFDTRNEIMYERMLIARQASRRGDHTGTIKLPDVNMVEEELAGDDGEVDGKGPRSVPPPPPKVPSQAPAKAPAKTLAKTPAKAPANATAKKALGAPKKKRKKKSSNPPANDVANDVAETSKTKSSTTPTTKSAVAPGKKTAASGPSTPANSTEEKAPSTDDATTTPGDLATPPAAKKRRRPSRIPQSIADGPYELDVPHELVAHARRLQDRIPRKLTNRDRTPKHPEAAVLKTALRIGLAALEALAEDD